LHAEIDDPRDGGTWPGLTVVFVHGYALNLDCYHYQRQALRGSVRLVFYDQRSHGRSERGSTESSTPWRRPGQSSWSATQWAA
jgi:pimeloyl-ACP methyl ester carboxylesterase